MVGPPRKTPQESYLYNPLNNYVMLQEYWKLGNLVLVHGYFLHNIHTDEIKQAPQVQNHNWFIENNKMHFYLRN